MPSLRRSSSKPDAAPPLDLAQTQLPAGAHAGAAPSSRRWSGDIFLAIAFAAAIGGVVGKATGVLPLGIAAGWYWFELLYPRLGAVVRGPYRLEAALYALPSRLLLGPLLALAGTKVLGDPTLGVVAAYGLLVALEQAFARLAMRFAPRRTLRARIALQRELRRWSAAASLEQRLRQLELETNRRDVARAHALEAHTPVKAGRIYEQVAAALTATPRRSAEETRVLADAYAGQGRVLEVTGDGAAAAVAYLAALRLGQTDVVTALAPLLAARRRTDRVAIDIYLEYMAATRAGGAKPPAGAGSAVVDVLADACLVTEDDTAEVVRQRVRLIERVLTIDDRLEWAHFSKGLAYLHGRYPQRDPETALAALERARDLDAGRSDTFSALADAFVELRRPAEAVEALESCLRLDPKQPKTSLRLAKLLIDLAGDSPGGAADGASDEMAGEEAAAQLTRAVHWLAHTARLTDDAAHFDLLGQVQLQRGRPAAAVAAFQRAAELRPGQAEYVYRLALAQRAAGQVAEAKSTLAGAVASAPDHQPAHTLLAELLFADGEYEAAAVACREVLRLDATDSVARYRLGRSLYELGRLDEAEAELARVDPEQSPALFYLARAQALAGRADRAVATLERLHAAFDPTADSLYYLGCALARVAQDGGGDPVARTRALEAALVAFAGAVESEPHRWQAHLQAGHVSRLLGRIAEARRHYLQAQAFRPDAPEVLCALAQVAHLSGEVALARDLFEQVAREAPDFAPAHLGLGVVHEAGGELERALVAYRLAGDDAAAGAVCCKLGDFAAACTHLLAAFEAGDTSDSLLNDLGYALAQSGEFARAKTAWRALAERNPDDSRLALNLARLEHLLGRQHALAGRYAEAAVAWTAYLETYGADDQVRGDLAEVFFRQGVEAMKLVPQGDSEARQALSRATELAPQNTEYAYRLALLDLTTDRPTAARVRLEALVEGEPDRPELLHHLAIALIRDGQEMKAREMLERAATLETTPALRDRTSWALAGLLAKDGDWQRAASLFAETVNASVAGGRPVPEVVARQMVLTFVNAGLLEEAESLLRSEALKKGSGLRHELAVAYAARGQFDAALKLFQLNLKEQPADTRDQAGAVSALRALAEQTAADQDWAGAAKWLEQALTLRPHDESLQQDLDAVRELQPLSLLAEDRREEAAAIWEQLQRSRPDNVNVAHRLAILYHRWAIEEETAGRFADADPLWPKAMANWSLVLATDAFWSAWTAGRQEAYGLPVVEKDVSALRERGLPERLEQVHRDFEDAYRQVEDRRAWGRHWLSRFELKLEVAAAQAARDCAPLLRARGKPAPLCAGPIMLGQLGLLNESQNLAAEAMRADPEAEAPRRLAAYLSPLGFYHILLDEGQVDYAIYYLKRRADGAVPDGKEFRFTSRNGQSAGTAHTLAELASVIETCSPFVLDWHLWQGDFSKWVGQVLGQKRVAAKLAKIEERFRRERKSDDALKRDLIDAVKVQGAAGGGDRALRALLTRAYREAAGALAGDPPTAIRRAAEGIPYDDGTVLRDFIAETCVSHARSVEREDGEDAAIAVLRLGRGHVRHRPDLDRALASVLNRKAVRLHGKGRFQEAYALVEEAFALDTQDVTIRNNYLRARLDLAYQYLQDDRWGDAIGVLRQVLQGDPRNADANELMGRVYNRMGVVTYEAGGAQFQRDPKQAIAKLVQAQEYFETGIGYAPQNEQLRENLRQVRETRRRVA
jgi:tetratricopeptide (TPR) repeat protein